jgi:hypothetical protein
MSDTNYIYYKKGYGTYSIQNQRWNSFEMF